MVYWNKDILSYFSRIEVFTYEINDRIRYSRICFYCKQLIEAYKQEQPDKLLLLGDLLYHGPRNDLPKDYAPKQVIEMLNAISDQLICVRGNCEAEVDQMVLNFLF